MDLKDLDAGCRRQEAFDTQINQHTLEHMKEVIKGFISSSKPYVYHFFQGSDYSVFAELLGIREFESSKIKHLYYQNTFGGTDEDASPNYSGEISLDMALSILADRHAMVEDFPNNFKSGVLIEIDQETAAAFGIELDEQPSVCPDCNEEDDHDHNSMYSCEHREDTYSARHWAIILTSDRVKDIDWETGDLS